LAHDFLECIVRKGTGKVVLLTENAEGIVKCLSCGGTGKKESKK